jgi:hypothetical protein
VTEALKSPELCRIAVGEDSWALEYEPERLKSLALCEAAVRTSVHAFEFVPKACARPCGRH